MANNDAFITCSLSDGAAGRIWSNLLYQTANGYLMNAIFRDDAGVGQTSGYQIITDAPHRIEIRAVYSTGESTNDAAIYLYVDDVLVKSNTGLDVYSQTKPDRVQIGAVSGIDAGTSGTLFHDELHVRNDDIPVFNPAGTKTVNELAHINIKTLNGMGLVYAETINGLG